MVIKNNTIESKTKISNQAIWTIRGSKDIRMELQRILNISKPTLFRYLKERAPELTQEDVVNYLMTITRQTREQILEREPATAA